MKKFISELVQIFEDKNYITAETSNELLIFSFAFLKLLDGALKFSKNSILNEFNNHYGCLSFEEYTAFNQLKKYGKSEEILDLSIFHEKAIFPSGEKLGFFNLSQYDLDLIIQDSKPFSMNRIETENGFEFCNYESFEDFDDRIKINKIHRDYFDRLDDYIFKFNPVVNNFFQEIKFRELIYPLSRSPNFSIFLEEIISVEIDENIFKNHYNFEKAVNELIYEYITYMTSKSKSKMLFKLKDYPELLIEYLLNDVSLEDITNINLYDPHAHKSTHLLFMATDYIKEINPDCIIRYFGRDKSYIFKFLNIIRKENYSESNLKLNEFINGSINQNLETLDVNLDFKCGDDTLNLIISDKWYKHYQDFFNYQSNTKVLMVTTSIKIDRIIENLFPLIKEDKVESIVAIPIDKGLLHPSRFRSYENYIIITLSNFKKYIPEGKILFADYTKNSFEFSEKFEKKDYISFLNQFSQYIGNLKDSDNSIILPNSYFIENEKSKEYLFSFDYIMYDVKMPYFKDIFYKKRSSSDLDELIKPREKIFNEISYEHLGELVEFNKGNDENSIFLIRSKDLEVQIYNKKPDKKYHYTKLNVKKEYKILKEYLYHYLKSNKGISEIKYFTRGRHSREPEDLKKIKVPLPKLSDQKKVINAVNTVNNFFNDLNYLKEQYQNNILDYENILGDIEELTGNIEISEDGITTMNKSIGHAYESLLWPIAITFLFATNGEHEETLKAKNHLRLFEFVTIFNSIILLSAIPKETYNEIKYRFIWNGNWSKYKSMYFGVWCDIYRKLHNSYIHNEFTTLLNKNLFMSISTKELVDLMYEVKKYRNNDSHDALSNHYEVKEILSELESKLLDLKNYLDVYSDYKLFYFEERKAAYDDDQDIYYVMYLNGPYAQPIYYELITSKRLKKDSLYLYDPNTDNFLLINDNLMKFIQNNNKQWRLYVFVGYEENESNELFAIYKCFQQNIEDYKIKINSFKEDIIG